MRTGGCTLASWPQPFMGFAVTRTALRRRAAAAGGLPSMRGGCVDRVLSRNGQRRLRPVRKHLCGCGALTLEAQLLPCTAGQLPV